jgi:chemotaxis methyl-accepting protein methylase
MHFDAFLREVCPPLDLDWRKYRRRSARRRVLGRIRELGLEGFKAYLDYLRAHPEEAVGLANRMRVTVSRFFRDRDRWETLREAVLPVLLEGRESPLWALSAGCCGGEEPYSLAILWMTNFQSHILNILAVDLDQASLERAAEGLYPHSALREVTPELQKRFFRPKMGRLRLDPQVRSRVSLVRASLESLPFCGEFDLILCRYLVFTYYRGKRRFQAARRLWNLLRPGGALMIGAKEGLGPVEQSLFVPWPGAQGVFRRRSAQGE